MTRPDPTEASTGRNSRGRNSQGRNRKRRGFSALNRRILALNVIALAFFVGGVLYLDQSRAGLIETRLRSLEAQAGVIAGALGEAAVPGPEVTDIEPGPAEQILRRLVDPTQTRARLFTDEGQLLLDSRTLRTELSVTIEDLPPPSFWNRVRERLAIIDDWIASRISRDRDIPLYVEPPDQSAGDFPEVTAALSGTSASAVRRTDDNTLVLSAAVPVQRLKRVSGALLLSVETSEIEQIVEQERTVIWQVFAIALLLAISLSLFLSSTIVRPVRRLAQAADQIRRGDGEGADIPDYGARKDEIGDLAGALKDMTDALYRRIDAIEHFAADVAHEIKNPLTSIRSAIETLARTGDEDRRRQLIEIIGQDVERANRLITDISDASRLDATLSRERMDEVDLNEMLRTVVEIYGGKAEKSGVAIALHSPGRGERAMMIRGLKGPLTQVFANLLDNAISFSPENGRITVGARENGDHFVVTVDDNGPGIPESIRERIFERFYTERPEAESFGGHSGLGLNICKQIVEVHGGSITAENLVLRGDREAEKSGQEPDSHVLGARFTVRLPRLKN